MPGTRPLFSNRASSDISGDRDIAEEDALLTGQRTQRTTGGPRTWKFWREIGLFVWAVLATIGVIILAVVYQKHGGDTKHDSAHPSGKRNLIFMVSDGMGPTSLSLTRSFMQFQNGAPFSEQLVIDKHLIGQSRTRSSSSLITDSAAGATAFSCGKKSYNGAISITPDHEPCGTVLEAAKKAGYMTGLVVTTRITDATPACFAAHVNMRQEEDRIAEQMVGDYPLGRVVDLMFGGGRCHFLPNSTVESSCRADDKDIVALAKKNGYNYIDDRAAFDKLKGGAALDLPMLGLFADTDIPYEIDRRNENDVYPSLKEMAEAAMKALSHATRDSDKGYFLMIEGSRIDHAGHHNDPAAQVHEVLAYDNAFTSVLDFLKNDDTEAVMVSTSDHETGGLATARRTFSPLLQLLIYMLTL
jgi:alkaline phosphatase